MTQQILFRIVFLFLLMLLFVMRFYFMNKVRRSGERLTPDEQAIQREGGRAVFMIRVVGFFTLLAFLGMYLAGMRWIDAFRFPLPDWLLDADLGEAQYDACLLGQVTHYLTEQQNRHLFHRIC